MNDKTRPAEAVKHPPLEFREQEAASQAVLEGPVMTTFFYYAIPSMVGLVALTTSNLVDGVFVGNYVGSDALAAITLLIPVFTVLFATALMFAIGGSVAAGKHIGEGNVGAASSVFSQTLIGTALAVALFVGACTIFEGPLYELLHVPTTLVPLVDEYFDVIRWVLILQLSTMVLYYFVRADGYPVLATGAIVIGGLGNIGLDALFVVHYRWGLAGAAYAVVISQGAQAVVLSSYFFMKNRTLEFSFLQRDWAPLLRAVYNGVSEFINEISVGIVLWILNLLLLERSGVSGVAAFSVVNYGIFLSLMLTYGVADALHLLVSQNFGAGNHLRIGDFLRTALACSLGLGTLLAAMLLTMGSEVAGWFLGAPDALARAEVIELTRVVWPLFLVNGTNVIFSCYLTAIQEPRPSALVAILRGLVFPTGLLLGLSFLFERAPFRGEVPEWAFLAALPLAEWLTFAVAVALVYKHRPTLLGLRA